MGKLDKKSDKSIEYKFAETKDIQQKAVKDTQDKIKSIKTALGI